MQFIKSHKFFFAIIGALLLFVGYNLYQFSDVKEIDQTEAPSVAQVDEASSTDISNNQEEASVDVSEDNTQTEQEDSSQSATLATGSFQDGALNYSGQGSFKIVEVDGKVALKLQDDFAVDNGPDLFVYVSENSNPKDQGLAEFVSLGNLKKNSGAQVYVLPENWQQYKSVTIWCRAFNAVFSFAPIDT